MSQRPLGFGIWGTGMIAEFHAKALAEIPGKFQNLNEMRSLI